MYVINFCLVYFDCRTVINWSASDDESPNKSKVTDNYRNLFFHMCLTIIISCRWTDDGRLQFLNNTTRNLKKKILQNYIHTMNCLDEKFVFQ